MKRALYISLLLILTLFSCRYSRYHSKGNPFMRMKNKPSERLAKELRNEEAKSARQGRRQMRRNKKAIYSKPVD